MHPEMNYGLGHVLLSAEALSDTLPTAQPECFYPTSFMFTVLGASQAFPRSRKGWMMPTLTDKEPKESA